MVPGKEWGNASGFSLHNRSDWGTRTEDNIEAVGVDTEVTGRHWMLAKKNDLVTEKSVTTEDQIKKTAKWDETFNLGLFDDPQVPLQDYEGTKYHFADLYADLMEDPSVKVIKVPVVQDLDKFKSGDDSQITHPERFTREGINNLMKDIWVFNCQMMLSPEDPAKKRFTPQMIKYYEELPEILKYVLLVDPANEKKKRSDYTAMMVVGIGLTHYYVVYVMRDKLGPDERIDAAIDLIQRFNIQDVAWEKIGLNNDTFYLEEKRREKNLSFHVKEITSHVGAKVDRIRDILVPQYAQGKWLWPKKGAMDYFSIYENKTIDMVRELEMEFLQFPNGKHDDMLDCGTFLPHLKVSKPQEPSKPKPTGLTFGKYVRMKEDRIRSENADPWSKMNFPSRI